MDPLSFFQSAAVGRLTVMQKDAVAALMHMNGSTKPHAVMQTDMSADTNGMTRLQQSEL
jgi:hypothetical protein